MLKINGFQNLEQLQLEASLPYKDMLGFDTLGFRLHG